MSDRSSHILYDDNGIESASMPTNECASKWICTIFCVAAAFSLPSLPLSIQSTLEPQIIIYVLNAAHEWENCSFFFFFYLADKFYSHSFLMKFNAVSPTHESRSYEASETKWRKPKSFSIFAIHSLRKLCAQCAFLQCNDSVASRTVLAVIIIQNNCDQRKFVCTITL